MSWDGVIKMREINFLTWNTQLYEMGNIVHDGQAVKKIDMLTFKNVINQVEGFLNSHNEAVAILQEIPFKCNVNSKFGEHILFRNFIKAFPDDKYDMLYNISSDNQIKMTVVLAKKIGLGKLIYRKDNALNNNMCVSFGIKDLDLSITGVHLHEANDLLNWLQENSKPDIILGDFNAGDYKKKYECSEFKDNRENYKKLISGYTDICNGQVTRKIVFSNGSEYETAIDHVLFKKSYESTKKYQCKNIVVNPNRYNASDHYLIFFKLLYI